MNGLTLLIKHLIQTSYAAGAAKRLLALALSLLPASHCAPELVATTIGIALVAEAWFILDATNGDPLP